jgi:hypothetical protein
MSEKKVILIIVIITAFILFLGLTFKETLGFEDIVHNSIDYDYQELEMGLNEDEIHPPKSIVENPILTSNGR